jgi:hypothetical protein
VKCREQIRRETLQISSTDLVSLEKTYKPPRHRIVVMTHGSLEEIDHMSTSLQHSLETERIHIPSFRQGLHETRPMEVDYESG